MHRQPNQGRPSFNEYKAGDGCYMEYLHRPVEVSSFQCLAGTRSALFERVVHLTWSLGGIAILPSN